MTVSSKSENTGSRVLLKADDLSEVLNALADKVMAGFPDPSEIAVLGIRTRGAVLAERLHGILEQKSGATLDLGILDITLYRDDLSDLGPQPMVGESDIDFDLTGRRILLVDDVLFTGRTVRAAMDEIVDFGRPGCIRLAVLVDRGMREYPIQADYAGLQVPTTAEEVVRVKLRETDGDEKVILERLS